MRHLYKIFFAILLLLPSASYGEEIFAKLAEHKQVESTYVSGRFAHNMKRWNSRSGQHALNLSDGFSSLYNYQCYSTESVALARKILKDYLDKDKDMELVMRTNNYGAEYMVYEKFNKDNKPTRMLIWDCEAPNLCEIVVVDWKDGLVRSTSSVDFVRPDSSVTISVDNFSDLAQLSELSKLSELGDLPGLSKLSELSELSKLSELSELSDLSELTELIDLSDFNGIITIEQK